MFKLYNILITGLILASSNSYAKPKGFIPTIDPNVFYGFKNPVPCPFKDQTPRVVAKSSVKDSVSAVLGNTTGVDGTP